MVFKAKEGTRKNQSRKYQCGRYREVTVKMLMVENVNGKTELILVRILCQVLHIQHEN